MANGGRLLELHKDEKHTLSDIEAFYGLQVLLCRERVIQDSQKQRTTGMKLQQTKKQRNILTAPEASSVINLGLDVGSEKVALSAG